MIPLVLACLVLAEPVAGPVLIMPPELADDAPARFRIRVRPAGWDGARLEPEGEPIGGATVGRPDRPPAELVVVRPGRLIRVVVEDGPLRLLLYLPPEGLRDVVVRPAIARREPRPDAPGVEVAAGTPLERLEMRAGWVRTPLGWFAVAELGKMYPAPAGAPAPAPAGPPCRGTGPDEDNPNRVWLPAGTLLTDAPEGAVVARLMQPATLFADARVGPGDWLRLRAYGDWGEIGLWWPALAGAFRPGTFGQMIRNGRFFWRRAPAEPPACRAYRVAPEAGSGWQGMISPEDGGELGYRYHYAVGMLTLETERGGGFEALGILSCGTGCLQVGEYRWYFEAQSCQGAPASGR